MMSTLRLQFARFVALGILLACPAIVSAQTWSPAQTDVWKHVEAYWALDAAGDTAGFLAYFHPEYSGWSVRDALPSTKARAEKFIAHQHRTGKTLIYDIQPLSIKVHGNIAIVHYYWTSISQRGNDAEKSRSGRWTDILAKNGDKWVLIADHGGASSDRE